MSNESQVELRNLTDIISSLEEKLLHLTLDLQAAKTSLTALNEQEEQHPKTNPSDILTRPRRSKRDKSTRSVRPQSTNRQPSNRRNRSLFEVGDRIRVVNPNKRQPVTTGSVTGYTSNGFIKFELDDGTKTCRAAHNLILISSEH